MNILTGNKEFFKGIGQIKYEGNETDNPLAFRWYDENKTIAGKTMKEYLRFACAYWHSFCNVGADPFGEGTHLFSWIDTWSSAGKGSIGCNYSIRRGKLCILGRSRRLHEPAKYQYEA